jgi:hypothetical protein
VRKGYAFPVNFSLDGLRLRLKRGRRSRENQGSEYRKGRAFPHIRRHSRHRQFGLNNQTNV